MGTGSFESLTRHTGHVHDACIHNLVRIRHAEQLMLLEGMAMPTSGDVMPVRNGIATYNARTQWCSHSFVIVREAYCLTGRRLRGCNVLFFWCLTASSLFFSLPF